MVVTVCLSDEDWQKVDRIPGWLSRQEADLLYELCQPPWCEVGSWLGRSLNVLEKKGHGYAVESFQARPELSHPDNTRENFRRYTEKANFTLLDGDFRDMAEQVPEIAFLHLDADHSYQGTKEAFDLYAPKLRKGCFLVLHDVFTENPKLGHAWPGVYRFASELMADPGWICVGGAGRSAAFRKL